MGLTLGGPEAQAGPALGQPPVVVVVEADRHNRTAADLVVPVVVVVPARKDIRTMSLEQMIDWWWFHIPVNTIKDISEPPHDKTNKMTCAHSEDSDQPGHPPSLISLRCSHEEALGPKLSIYKVHSKDSDQNGQMPKLIWVCWAHMSFCLFCHAVAHMWCCLFICVTFMRLEINAELVPFSNLL